MGFGTTVKNMLSTDDTANDIKDDRAVGTRGGTNGATTYEIRDNNFIGNRNSSQLPPGTGPGTSGKPAVASELAMQNDLERSRAGQGTSGYGTDAAAAVGGTLAGTHQGKVSSSGNSRTAARNTSGSGTATGLVLGPTAHRKSMEGVTTGGQAPPVNWAGEMGPDTEGAMRATTTYREPTGQGLGAEVGRGGVLEEGHGFGHIEHNAPGSMPTGSTIQHTNQLHPVIHERVRHLEIEEIAHVKNRERHIHHIQHHTQPVTLSEELQERVRENLRPVTHVKEIHANKPEDSTVFEGQIYQHRDSLSHLEKERTIIDKGTTVNEIIHHHVHHVIQPVIEKETIAKERIRTTVPIHEVTQEAPVIHQSQPHVPVDMAHFVKGGGIVKGGVAQDDIIRKVLHNGKCVREIHGAGDSFGDMSSGNKNVQDSLRTTSTSSMDDSKTGAQRNSSFNQANVVPSRN